MRTHARCRQRDLRVIEVVFPTAVAVQIGFTREVALTIVPASEAQNVLFEGVGQATVTVDAISGEDVTLDLQVSFPGEPAIVARLGPNAPVISQRNIDEFETSVSFRIAMVINSETKSGISIYTMTPFVEGLDVNFTMSGSGSFGGGVTNFTVTTSESEGWVVDDQTGVGTFAYELEISSPSDDLCHNITIDQVQSTRKTVASDRGINNQFCIVTVDEVLLCLEAESEGDIKITRNQGFADGPV